MRIQPSILARRHQGRFAGESLSPAKRPGCRAGRVERDGGIRRLV